MGPVAEDETGEFEGSEQYQVIRRLGRGGMGTVYLVRDQRRRADVALKTLHRIDASSLYQFKQEFRVLADVSHPNLVALYELQSANDRWFFTMEWVDGVDFLQHVCGDKGDRAGSGPPCSSWIFGHGFTSGKSRD